jgi:hypothetical protein
MESKWKIKRITIEYPDGQRRWDCVFQFLLECANEASASQKEMEDLSRKEIDNGSSSICTCFNDKSTAETDY